MPALPMDSSADRAVAAPRGSLSAAERQQPTGTPLRDVQVDAQIVDVVAQLTVKQSFFNDELFPIEAVHVFPLDDNAAVCDFSIVIGDKIIQGAMDETYEAQKAYNRAKSDGDGAYLLEQPIRDMFQISVANLPPGQRATVEISYIKLGRGNDKGAYPIPTWYTSHAGSAQGMSFLAVENRSEGEKTEVPPVMRKVPVSPRPGDYFNFGAAVEPTWSGIAWTTGGGPLERAKSSPVLSHFVREDLENGNGNLIQAANARSRDVNSFAELVITSGSGQASATASTETLTKAEDAVAEAVAEAIADVTNGGNSKAVADATAKAIGEAAATAVAEASAQVILEGTGNANAMASANAKAVARVVATAIAKAFAEGVGDNVKAASRSEARITEIRIVQALAGTTVSVQTDGGEAEAFSSVIAEAVTQVVAVGLAKALAEVAAGVAETQADAEAQTDVKDETVVVDSTNDTKTSGNAEATADAQGDASTALEDGAEKDNEDSIQAAKVVDRGVDTFAELLITSGTGQASATASTEILIEAENAVAKAVAEAIADVTKGGDAIAASKTAAEAVGVATATAIAETAARVNVEGTGNASATASASVEAVARAVAMAIAEAFAEGIGDNVKAASRAEAKVTEVWIVRALAGTSVSAQTDGGQAEAFSSVAAEAVASVVAVALARAFAEIGDGVAKTEGEAEATTDVRDESVVVDSSNDTKTSGNADATADGQGDATTAVEDELDEDEELTQAVKAESRAVSSFAELLITSGSGQASATASSETLRTTEDAVAKAVAEAIADVTKGGNARAAADTAAEAIGVATATAIAETAAEVKLEGTGNASAVASANVEAVARVVATAIAEAFAKGVGDNVTAISRAETRVTEIRIVRALAGTSVSVQTTGGEAEAFSSVIAEAVVEVVAAAVARALANVATGEANAEAEGEATTDVGKETVVVDSTNDAQSIGNSQATGDAQGDAQTLIMPDGSTNTGSSGPSSRVRTTPARRRNTGGSSTTTFSPSITWSRPSTTVSSGSDGSVTVTHTSAPFSSRRTTGSSRPAWTRATFRNEQ